MPERPMVSANALAAFSAFLPSDLTSKQADKVLEAAEALAQHVWREAAASQGVKDAMRREFRPATPEGDKE